MEKWEEAILSEDEAIAAFEEGNPTDDHAIGCRNIAKAQAKPSFETGEKRIIDWLNEKNTLKLKSLQGTPDWYKHCGLLIPDETWQTFLKSLGIEGEK